MVNKLPKDIVAERWNTKDAAADAIVALIGDPDGKTKDRLKRASNLQLIQLYEAGEELKKRFNSRDNLETEILKAKFPGGQIDETYKGRLQGYGVRRLLDLHRQLKIS